MRRTRKGKTHHQHRSRKQRRKEIVKTPRWNGEQIKRAFNTRSSERRRVDWKY